MHRFDRGVQLVRRRIAGLGHEHNAVHIGRNDLCVRDRVDRRRIDDNIVIDSGAFAYKCSHSVGSQQLRRIRRDGSRTDDPERKILHLCDLQLPDLRQKIAEARRKLHLPKLALRRLAHIRIDQQDFLSKHRVADRNVGRRQALALRGLGACDGEGLAGALLVCRHAEHQTGAELDIGLLDRKRRCIVQEASAVDGDGFTCRLAACFLRLHCVPCLLPSAPNRCSSYL